MKLAQRMSRLGTETAFDVLAQVRALQAQGRDIISFAIGEPDFDTPTAIREAGKKAIDQGWTHYAPSAGLEPLREAVAADVNRTRGSRYTAENVVITPGAKPNIFFSLLALVEEGDEVIYPNPGFPIYESMIDFSGARAVPLPMEEAHAFGFDLEKLEQLISERTRLIILNSPHNPTGGVVPGEVLERVAHLACKHDFWVLSDEIYSRLVYDGPFESITAFEGMEERTIILDGHSKTYAMTGWRLGYGVMPAELARAAARLMTNSNSCTASFTQMAGIEAVTGDQAPSEEMKQIFNRRRTRIVEGLNAIAGVTCLMPAGAFYVWPNVTEVCRTLELPDSVALQQYLLHEAGVAVLARSCFGRRAPQERREYVRIAYAASDEMIEEGLKRMEGAAVDRDRARTFRKTRRS